jgi:rSAM/selenodomain-associated transferase 2
MPTGVSFVIPALNEAENIGPLLLQLRSTYPEAELVVVDGGSDDDTVATAMPLCDLLLLGAQGRANQMNLGGRAARREYLLFLHADSVPGVSAPSLSAYLAERPQWGFCRVRLSGPGPVFRVIERCMNLRSAVTKIATGDQMLFVRRELFEETGGFEPIPLMEDIAYCRRLRRMAAPRVVREPVVTSSRRWEARGVVRTVLQMWALRLAYFLGASPARLWQHYYGR